MPAAAHGLLAPNSLTCTELSAVPALTTVNTRPSPPEPKGTSNVSSFLGGCGGATGVDAAEAGCGLDGGFTEAVVAVDEDIPAVPDLFEFDAPEFAAFAAACCPAVGGSGVGAETAIPANLAEACTKRSRRLSISIFFCLISAFSVKKTCRMNRRVHHLNINKHQQ